MPMPSDFAMHLKQPIYWAILKGCRPFGPARSKPPETTEKTSLLFILFHKSKTRLAQKTLEIKLAKVTPQ